MSAATRLKKLEAACPFLLRIAPIAERLERLESDPPAQDAFFNSLSHKDALGALKYSVRLRVSVYGLPAVRAMLEETGQYHAGWIDWFTDGNFDEADIAAQAKNARALADTLMEEPEE